MIRSLGHVAIDLGVTFIWIQPCVSLQNETGDKIQVHGKRPIPNIRFENATFHLVAYVVDISHLFILGLNFLKDDNFKLDCKKNNLHSRYGFVQHQKIRRLSLFIK